HVIYSVGFAMQEIGYEIINDVVWEKPNPPPNLSCRFFTHSKETILWAAKSPESAYYFDYQAMRGANEDRQMKDVWRFTAPPRSERKHGKHPTQKPLGLLRRILGASARPGAVVLDPFNGSGTTGIVALEIGLTYIGIERETKYLALSKRRLQDSLGQEVDDDPACDSGEDDENEETTGSLF